MIYLSTIVVLISQLMVLYYLYKKSAAPKDSFVLALVHTMGLLSVWWQQILTGFNEIWLLLGFVLYQWLFALLVLYVNKKIKEQQ